VLVFHQYADEACQAGKKFYVSSCARRASFEVIAVSRADEFHKKIADECREQAARSQLFGTERSGR
jgi:hypothetical protein